MAGATPLAGASGRDQAHTQQHARGKPAGARGARAALRARSSTDRDAPRTPNTVAIYDYGVTADGLFYYAMEFLDGTTASNWSHECGALDPGPRRPLRQAARARRGPRPSASSTATSSPKTSSSPPGRNEDFVKVLDFGLVKHQRRRADGHDGVHGRDCGGNTRIHGAGDRARSWRRGRGVRTSTRWAVSPITC